MQSYLDEAVHLGVKEYYFTGGEPFINREMEEILTATLKVGPATVLTNGLLLDPGRCQRLAEMAERSEYSLDLRVSIDGYTAGGERCDSWGGNVRADPDRCRECGRGRTQPP